MLMFRLPLDHLFSTGVFPVLQKNIRKLILPSVRAWTFYCFRQGVAMLGLKESCWSELFLADSLTTERDGVPSFLVINHCDDTTERPVTDITLDGPHAGPLFMNWGTLPSHAQRI